MLKNIKLIWDFRGPFAGKTAEHHQVHLTEYCRAERLSYTSGFEIKNELFAIAYMVVPEEHMIAVRDALRPHRAEIY